MALFLQALSWIPQFIFWIWGQQTFYVQSQTVNILGFANHMLYATGTQLFHCGTKTSITICKWMVMAVFQ